MEIQYEIQRKRETIGDISLELDCLKDLNETIDRIFAYLERSGRPEALEDLCPYFGVIWPAARGLAQFLIDIPSAELSGRRVLELGCGLAIPSMIAEKREARVTATDFHPMVPVFLEKNIALNQLKNFEYLHVNWEKEELQLEPYDWVIGSDILYESRYPGPLAREIARRVNPGGRVVIADPGRPYLQAFVDEMKHLGFMSETQIRTVPDNPSPKDVFVIQFQMK